MFMPGFCSPCQVGNVKRVEHLLCDASGCTDPVALNGPQNGAEDHSCIYQWRHGFVQTQGSDGHSAGHISVEGIRVPGLDLRPDWLPTRAVTIECWLNLAQPDEWAGCMSFAQDDGHNEFGVTMSQRAVTAGTAQLAMAVSTLGATNVATNCLHAEMEGGQTTCGMTYAYSAATTVRTNEWHHFAGTYDGTTIKVYIDGQDTGLADVSQSGDIAYPQMDYQAMTGGWFTIGAYADTNEYWPIHGSTDEVRLWNVARSAADIAAGNCGPIDVVRGLLGYWKFNENYGADMFNAVPHAPQGILRGNIKRVGTDGDSELPSTAGC